MAPKLDDTGVNALKAVLSEPISNGSIPATTLGVTNAEETLFFEFSGDRVYGEPQKGQIDENTIVQLFSATKLATTVACLILVDRGTISLDDPEVIHRHLPEFDKLEIFKGYDDAGKPMEEKRQNRDLTLRHLLSHTSGLSYAGFDPPTQQWIDKHNVSWLIGGGRKPADISSLDFPLVYEPGTGWSYSPGIDWAGVLINRTTGQDLETFFKENIFKPLGMTSTTFFPTDEVKNKLQAMVKGHKDGTLEVYPDNFESIDMPREGDPEKVGPLLAGGAGLFGTAKDFLLLLRAILQSGLSGSERPTTALLSKKSADELFTDVCPTEQDRSVCHSGKQSLLKMMGMTGYHDPALLADKTGSKVGHAVGLNLNLVDSGNGRKAMSGCWDGMAKTPFWIDPKSGVTAVCFTNLFQGLPSAFVDTYVRFEKTLYEHLVLDKRRLGPL